MIAPAFVGSSLSTGGSPWVESSSEIVELPLLLPKDWAVELLEIAESRKQTMANLIRELINEAIRKENSQRYSSWR